MVTNDLILERLDQIEKKLDEQGLLQKNVLNFNEACRYLDVSASHLYKMTSSKKIPHFCPNGKRLYFNRQELEDWLLRNKQLTNNEIEEQANNYLLMKGRARK